MPTNIINLPTATPMPPSPKKVPPTLTISRGGGIYLVVVFLILSALAVAIATGTTTAQGFLTSFPTEIVFILISLDLISRFIASTQVLTWMSLQLANRTGGELHKVVLLSGVFMFTTSAVLNNLAATFVLASVFLAVLRDLNASPKIVNITLAMLVCVTNLGGAATPIGDFPAIILLTSGATDFVSYMMTAGPLFMTTALIAINVYAMSIRRMDAAANRADSTNAARSKAALALLRIKYERHRTDWKRAIGMGFVFSAMVAVWALVDPQTIPFHLTAIIGCVLIAAVAGIKTVGAVLKSYDLGPTVFIIAVLALATEVGETGWLENLADVLKAYFPNPLLLLVAIMATTTIASGLVSAGPAAAAMLPLILELSDGPFQDFGVWPATAFAASICAGSSFFLTSATSGPALAGEARKAEVFRSGQAWGFVSYMGFGVVNCLFQFTIALAWILVALNDTISTPLKAFVSVAIPLALLSLTIRNGLTQKEGRQPVPERSPWLPTDTLIRIAEITLLVVSITALIFSST